MCRVNGPLHCIWLLNLLLISCVRTDSQRAERERITQPDPVPRPGGLDGPSNKFFFTSAKEVMILPLCVSRITQKVIDVFW